MLGDVPRSGSDVRDLTNEEAQPGHRPLGAVMRKIGAEEGWTVVKRSKGKKEIVRNKGT